jgi:hypothetical protein
LVICCAAAKHAAALADADAVPLADAAAAVAFVADAAADDPFVADAAAAAAFVADAPPLAVAVSWLIGNGSQCWKQC